jgi:hypothetical protein
VECTAALRSRGVSVGACSGYNAAIIEVVVAEAAKQGLVSGRWRRRRAQ